MKNFAARISVVALALTGFAASTVVSRAATQQHKVTPVVSVYSPAPMCMPSKPAPCGMD